MSKLNLFVWKSALNSAERGFVVIKYMNHGLHLRDIINKKTYTNRYWYFSKFVFHPKILVLSMQISKTVASQSSHQLHNYIWYLQIQTKVAENAYTLDLIRFSIWRCTLQAWSQTESNRHKQHFATIHEDIYVWHTTLCWKELLAFTFQYILFC